MFLWSHIVTIFFGQLINKLNINFISPSLIPKTIKIENEYGKGKFKRLTTIVFHCLVLIITIRF